jgi:hypothetical protein
VHLGCAGKNTSAVLAMLWFDLAQERWVFREIGKQSALHQSTAPAL